ncbi:hypothetical protein ACFQH2_03460 [Natronoarchaeum sp. GCM10025703]|uniref:hypothetical protein n=1 Tax=Natronoarchaeum sp. GCM10025703 TaxID=3252685 RepID=UPI0036075ECD
MSENQGDEIPERFLLDASDPRTASLGVLRDPHLALDAEHRWLVLFDRGSFRDRSLLRSHTGSTSPAY